MSADTYNATKAVLRALRLNAFNVQTLLQMDSKRENSDKIRKKAISLISNHFTRVEKTYNSLDLAIPQENLNDHKILLDHFKQLESDWQKKQISDHIYTEKINFHLFNHFSIYFFPLVDSVLLDSHTEES